MRVILGKQRAGHGFLKILLRNRKLWKPFTDNQKEFVRLLW
jgi:hypothetical protein